MTTDLISRKALEDLQEPAYNESHYIIDRVVSINAIRRLPTINAVVIPDNATNGDVIKAMFNGRDLSIITERLEYMHWWNAPYKNEHD